MQARPCLFVACAPSGSRIHPPYVKLFRKNCPAESTRIVERPKNQGPEQLRASPLWRDSRDGLPAKRSIPQSTKGIQNGTVPSRPDRKSTRLNSSHLGISYAV